MRRSVLHKATHVFRYDAQRIAYVALEHADGQEHNDNLDYDHGNGKGERVVKDTRRNQFVVDVNAHNERVIATHYVNRKAPGEVGLVIVWGYDGDWINVSQKRLLLLLETMNKIVARLQHRVHVVVFPLIARDRKVVGRCRIFVAHIVDVKMADVEHAANELQRKVNILIFFGFKSCDQIVVRKVEQHYLRFLC